MLHLIAAITFITSAPAQSVKPLVVYIGGALSTDTQMKCWAQGASGNTGYEFKAYPYPTGIGLNEGSDKTQPGKNLVAQIARDVANERRPIIVVGHSSGSDLANLLAITMHKAARPPARLIDIDGYGVPGEVSRDIPTTCISAVSKETGQKSPYWDKTHKLCPGREIRDLEISGCKTEMCLHFRMVNTTSDAKLGANYGKDGYNGCSPNLEWLSSPSGSNPPQAPTTNGSKSRT